MSAISTNKEEVTDQTVAITCGQDDGEEFSFSRILISGAGFLADAYDLFVINIAVDLMGRAGYSEPLTQETKSLIKSMALAGAVVGQLGFGSIADLIGRRKVFIMTCSMVIIGAVLSASAQNSGSGFGIYSQIALWRFVLGVGVGGEYPLSASVTSESSRSSEQTRNLAMVFSMQGVGTLLCSFVLITVTNTMGDNYDAQWRTALAIGAFPMICAFYFRWKMHETSWKEEANPPDISEEAVAAATAEGGIDKPRNSLSASLSRCQFLLQYFSEGLGYCWQTIRQNQRRLLGTAGAWFILDVVFYANGLFSGQVTAAMKFGSSPRSEATASLILQSLSLPGYICTVLYVDRIGLKRLQFWGFLATTLFFFLMAVLQPYLIQVPALYVIMYGCTFFFQNFGANPTTYIIPSIVYSTAHRATCHGISSAAGKMGALVGAQIFLYITDAFCDGDSCTDDSSSQQVNAGLQLTFFVCGALAIIGALWTHFLVDDTPASSKSRIKSVMHSTVDVEMEKLATSSSNGSGGALSPGSEHSAAASSARNDETFNPIAP